MTSARSRKGGRLRDERAERGIPEATVARLPSTCALSPPWPTATSPPPAARTSPSAAGVNSAKLRKDLSYLGTYGTRGVGYDVNYLRYQIAREIGLTQDWSVVIIGIGNLGHALANYSGFVSRGFQIAALLDSDPTAWASRSATCRSRSSTTSTRSCASGDVVDRRDRHAGRRRAGRLRPAGRGRRHEHPQLRPDRAVRARPGRRAQGRPVDRAADPRLPRAAQGAGQRTAIDSRSTRSTSCRQVRCEHPHRRRLPPHRAGRAARAAARSTPTAPPSSGRRRSTATTSPRPWCSPPATGSRSTPRSTASTAASRT